MISSGVSGGEFIICGEVVADVELIDDVDEEVCVLDLSRLKAIAILPAVRVVTALVNEEELGIDSPSGKSDPSSNPFRRSFKTELRMQDREEPFESTGIEAIGNAGLTQPVGVFRGVPVITELESVVVSSPTTSSFVNAESVSETVSTQSTSPVVIELPVVQILSVVLE